MKKHFKKYFLLQPAEKQLAATTTDLASNNPMRLLPIVAVLIAIVLLLVILAVIFVIIIRGKFTVQNPPKIHPCIFCALRSKWLCK